MTNNQRHDARFNETAIAIENSMPRFLAAAAVQLMPMVAAPALLPFHRARPAEIVFCLQ